MTLPTTQITLPGPRRVEGSMFYRIWAPAARTLAIVTLPDREAHPLHSSADGVWTGLVPISNITGPLRYKLRFTGHDGRQQELPDPLALYSPEGPQGPAELPVSTFEWTDAAWPGVELRGQILSEIHIGTFTLEGTYAAAAARLPALRDAGITVIELMPLAEFPGRFGWGYDGVQMFAPFHGYGTPDELRALINTAHSLGMGVMLDVVFNHFGPDGNYMGLYAPAFFTDRHQTPWGKALDFDSAQSREVRDFFLAVAEHWIRDYHFDGLRLDATQSMFDENSGVHILEEIAARVHDVAAPRKTIVVAENDERDSRLVRDGGFGLDGIWNDDLHHSVRVALTGVQRSYFAPFQGTPQELISAARNGFLFAGQSMVQNAGQMVQDASLPTRRRMGHSSRNVPLWRFIHYIENHDQVSVEKRGARLLTLTNLSDYRAMVMFLLLGPGTPMLFQGQEFGSRSPFPYFSDHDAGLQEKIREGRYEYLSQFTCGADCDDGAAFPDPCERKTVESATLRWDSRDGRPHLSSFFRDLMHLRRQETLLWDDSLQVEGSVVSAEAFLLRYSAKSGTGGSEERLLCVNLGRDWSREQLAEPLLGLPENMVWQPVISSEDPRYGGHGTQPLEDESGYHLSAHSALYLKAQSKR